MNEEFLQMLPAANTEKSAWPQKAGVGKGTRKHPRAKLTAKMQKASTDKENVCVEKHKARHELGDARVNRTIANGRAKCEPYHVKGQQSVKPRGVQGGYDSQYSTKHPNDQTGLQSLYCNPLKKNLRQPGYKPQHAGLGVNKNLYNTVQDLEAKELEDQLELYCNQDHELADQESLSLAD